MHLPPCSSISRHRRLTSRELCGLYDWAALAAGGPQRCPWYFPGLLKVGGWRVAGRRLGCGMLQRCPEFSRLRKVGGWVGGVHV